MNVKWIMDLKGPFNIVKNNVSKEKQTFYLSRNASVVLLGVRSILYINLKLQTSMM